MDTPTWEGTTPVAEVATSSAETPNQNDTTGTHTAEPTWEGSTPVSDFETPGQTLLTGVEGAAEGIVGPLGPLAEKGLYKLGVDELAPERQEARKAANPWTHGLAEAGGFGVSLATGMGIAPILGKIGKVALGATAVAKGLVAAEEALKIAQVTGKGIEEAQAALKIAKAATPLAERAAAGAIKMSAEMAALQAGSETSKYINDVPNSMGGALTNIGMSGLIGGLTGGAVPVIGAGIGRTTEKLGLKEFTDRLRYRMTGASDVEAISKEFDDAMGSYKDMNEEAWGPTGLKAQAMTKVMPEMSEKLTAQAQDIYDKGNSAIQKMVEEGVPQRYVEKVSKDFNRFQEVATRPDMTPSQLFDAANEFKSTLQGYSKGNYGPFAVAPHHEAYDFLNITKGLGRDIRLGLEDSSVWGKTADIQKNLNKAFSEVLPTIKDAQGKFMSKIAGEHVVDPAKLQTYINQNGKTTGSSIRQQMMGNFIDKYDKYQKTIADIYEKAEIPNPHEPVGLGALKDSLKKTSLWSKAADAWYDKALSHAAGTTIGSATGASLGSATGIPGAGWVGALLGGKVGEHVLPSILQPLMEKTISASGYQQAIKVGENAIKGESLIKSYSKALFKGGAMTGARVDIDDKKVDKLDKQVRNLSANPQKMQAINTDLEHYMPGHAQEAAAMTARAVQYLDSLRPHPDSRAPLDAPRAPSKAEMAPYERALGIAQAPLSVLSHMKDGTLLPQDVTTIKMISPGLYAKLSQQLLSEMTSHITAGEAVPYRLRQSLSLFLDQPMDSTFTPMSIIAAQPKPKEPQGAQQQGGGAKSTKSLGKSNKLYSTPSQTAERDRSGRD